MLIIFAGIIVILSLLKNGEYNNKPLLPFIAGGAAVFVLFARVFGKKLNEDGRTWNANQCHVYFYSKAVDLR